MQSASMQHIETPHTYYPGLDVLKFILAFFVLAEHVPIMSSLSGIGLQIGTAVLHPTVDIFFTISGFLCVDRAIHIPQKDKATAIEQRLLKSGKITLLLYIAWSVIYFPLNTVLSYTAGDFTVNTILPWILNYIRIFLFSGMWIYAPHLWYLLALGLGFLILHFCIKRKIPLILVFVISIVLTAIGSIIPSLIQRNKVIDFVYQHTFADTRNVVFTGMLYICLGVLMALYKDKVHISLPVLGLGTILGLIGLAIISHGFIRTICCMMFVSCITGISVYYRKTYTYSSLRLWGVIIYLIHIYVLKIVQFLIPRTGFIIVDINVTCLIFASLCSLLLALALASLVRRYSSLRFLFHA